MQPLQLPEQAHMLGPAVVPEHLLRLANCILLLDITKGPVVAWTNLVDTAMEERLGDGFAIHLHWPPHSPEEDLGLVAVLAACKPI